MDNKKVIEPEVITEVEGIKNNAIATMHNRFVEARYRLTIEEQRIVLALISLIQPEDEDFKEYKISVNVLQELTGTKRKDIYVAVKEAVERLLKRTIVIETEEDFEAFNFISYGRYRRGEGYFIISIDKHLKPYLLQLKERFTKIPLKYVFPLRSVYAIRLYELLKQYEGTGFRIDYLPDLREMLGVEPEEYKRFEAFERVVLKRAVKEINEKTDIEVSYTKKKTGRRVTHIKFTIRPKNTDENLPEETFTQQQKQAGEPDLWDTVLVILDPEEEEYNLLKNHTYARYLTDRIPKVMEIHADGRIEEVRNLLIYYWDRIREIVRIETNGSYTPKIHKSILVKSEPEEKTDYLQEFASLFSVYKEEFLKAVKEAEVKEGILLLYPVRGNEAYLNKFLLIYSDTVRAFLKKKGLKEVKVAQ